MFRLWTNRISPNVFDYFPLMWGSKLDWFTGNKRNVVCRLPCPPFPRFYFSMKECRARLRFAPRGRKERGEEGRKDDRVNIYPARNLIRRRGYRGWGIGLKILFPVQRSPELQDGSGWRFEKWGSELASRKVKRDVERNERIDEIRGVYRSLERANLLLIGLLGTH